MVVRIGSGSESIRRQLEGSNVEYKTFNRASHDHTRDYGDIAPLLGSLVIATLTFGSMTTHINQCILLVALSGPIGLGSALWRKSMVHPRISALENCIV